MRRMALLVTLVIAVVFVSPVSAAGPKPPKSSAGYGSAGCGWGGTVIPGRDFWSQFGAWVLNTSSWNQTFAITSGTSGCGKSGLVLAEKEQSTFVENNYGDLVREMAAGQGEHLSTLAGLLGCAASDVDAFGAFTQVNYTAIIPSDNTTPTEMLRSLKSGLAQDQRFNASCSLA